MTLKIKRLDHQGIVAGVINDLNIVPLLDKHLPQDDKQEITPGEAVKGMIMNALGFSYRLLSYSPQFFTNLPIEHLFREGLQPHLIPIFYVAVCSHMFLIRISFSIYN